MLLPNAEQAVIDLAKLADYCLSPTHPVGRHKARVFDAALGLTAQDAPRLAELLIQGVRREEAEQGRGDEHGQRYQVDVPVSTEQGEATVRTAWIIRSGEAIPRLITCYVLTDGGGQ